MLSASWNCLQWGVCGCGYKQPWMPISSSSHLQGWKPYNLCVTMCRFHGSCNHQYIWYIQCLEGIDISQILEPACPETNLSVLADKIILPSSSLKPLCRVDNWPFCTLFLFFYYRWIQASSASFTGYVPCNITRLGKQSKR